MWSRNVREHEAPSASMRFEAEEPLIVAQGESADG